MIKTRMKSSGGIYFTHVAAAWTMETWFKPVVDSGQLPFHIIKAVNANV